MVKKGTISKLIFVAIACFCVKTSLTYKKTTTEPQEVWITIFIHGALSAILNNVKSINFFTRLMRDRIEGTVYERATKHIRKAPLFRHAQAMQNLGLQKISKDQLYPGNTSAALANIFDKWDQWIHKRKNKYNHYYTFGWPGLISMKEWKRTGNKFRKDLARLVLKFKSHGINPKLRIVGYSHGGTIATILPLSKINKKSKLDFSIDELILLGMPINDEANIAINHPIFKKVYNIYSKSDIVQRLDLTLPGSLFTRRLFINKKGVNLPEKLTQIQITMRRNRTTKKKWSEEKDPRKNFLKNPVFYGNTNLLRNISPGHTELWFFDWVRKGYRERIPLKPFPIAAFLPLIIEEVKKIDSQNKKITVDLRPQQKTLILRTKKDKIIKPLFSEEKLSYLEKIAKSCSVKKFDEKEYEKIVKEAILKARKEIKKEKSKKLTLESNFIPQIEKILHAQLLCTLEQYILRNI